MKQNYFDYIVTKRNQLEVAPLKNLFFLAVLKLHLKDSFGYNNETEPSRQYKLIMHKHCLACILLCLTCTLEWTWKWKSQGYIVVLHG